MKIVVCMKQVPATTSEKRYGADFRLERSASESIINPLDEYAIEQALRLADDGKVESVGVPVDGSRAGAGSPAPSARHGRRRGVPGDR